MFPNQCFPKAFSLLVVCCSMSWLLYLLVTAFFKTGNFSAPPISKINDSKGKYQAILEMQGKLNKLQENVIRLERENELLRRQYKPMGEKQENDTKPTKKSTSSLPRPEHHELANNENVFARLVTFILYHQQGYGGLSPSISCTKKTQDSLTRLFPNITVLVASQNSSPGYTFNLLLPKVKTKYFFFLESGHELFPQISDHSAGWLLHALENVPELDFVSGSILDNDQLDIPCYRLLLCNWTLSERYEYRRSIDELMICDNIASSFMGRTKSIARIFPNQTHIFDEKMPLLFTTDFFLRAKRSGSLSGVRPEVMFRVRHDRMCKSTVSLKRREYYLTLLPFAHKHKVFRFKKPDSPTLDLCGNNSPIIGEDICEEPTAHKIMLNGHWAYKGTFAYPYIIRNIQQGLFEITDLLTAKGIVFSIEGGVSLGAVKLGAVLPWDAGDVDVFVYNVSMDRLYHIVSTFANQHDYYASLDSRQISLFCVPSKLKTRMGGMVSISVAEGEPPREFIRIKTNGRWIPYRRDIFKSLRNYFELSYLKHRIHIHNEVIHCAKEGHNACLPDFRKLGDRDGSAGTYREYFCTS